jgi:cysteine/O-acetylserine efflux protein
MVNLMAFLSFVFLTAYTPGPNNIMAMTNAGQNGFKKGFRLNFGILIGFIVVMTLSVIFSSMLYRYIPTAEPYMFTLGALYILWLAWTIVKDKPHEDKDIKLKLNSIFTGAVLQLVNPKVILYGITAFSTFILPYYHTLPELSVFILVLSVIGFSGSCCWAMFGAAFQKLFTQHKKGLNMVMALLLVYCAISLSLSAF